MPLLYYCMFLILRSFYRMLNELYCYFKIVLFYKFVSLCIKCTFIRHSIINTTQNSLNHITQNTHNLHTYLLNHNHHILLSVTGKPLPNRNPCPRNLIFFIKNNNISLLFVEQQYTYSISNHG